MKKRYRFLFLHKIVVVNILMAIAMVAIRPDIFDFVEDKKDFHFYLGTALVFAMFLEIGGIISKTKFIYARRENQERKIPIALGFSFLPRLLLASGIVILAFIGMGFFSSSDFILLPIVVYAVLKEFWVRGTLLNSDQPVAVKIGRGSVIVGEIFLFVFAMTVYVCLWELVLLDSMPFLRLIVYPAYYPILGAIFFILLLTIQMPYIMEEMFRNKSRRHRLISISSFALPVAAFLFDLARIGFKWKF